VRTIGAAGPGDWHAVLIDEPEAGQRVLSRLDAFAALRVDDTRTLVLDGAHAYVSGAATSMDPAGAVRVRGSGAIMLGNVLTTRGRSPAVEATAGGEILFSDNLCESQGDTPQPAVVLTTPVAIVNGNRVINTGRASIKVNGQHVAAVANITRAGIDAGLPAEMAVLNLIA